MSTLSKHSYNSVDGVNTFPYLGLYAGATSPLDKLVRSAPEFRDVQNPMWNWTKTYTSSDYTDMVSTHSDHLLMEAPARDALLSEVRSVIDAAGGSIDVEYITGLYLAQRA